MPLPLNGTLSMDNIRDELNISTQSPFALDVATDGGYVAINQCSQYKPASTDPDAISEWYGYCHSCVCEQCFGSGSTCSAAVSDYGIACIPSPTVSPTPEITPPATPTTLGCGSSQTQSYLLNSANIYPDIVLGTLAGTTSIGWVNSGRPNKFDVYDVSGLVASTGWVGVATYPGPWGLSLNQPTIGTLSFSYSTANTPYIVRVVLADGDNNNPQSNSFTVTLNCTGSSTPTPTATPTKTPNSSPTPTITPSQAVYTVTVYASLERIPTTSTTGYPLETKARFYYWRNVPLPIGPSNTLLGGNIGSTSCNLLGTITVPANSYLTVGLRAWSTNRPIYYNLNTTSSSCSLDGTEGCGTVLDASGGTTFQVNSNMTIGIMAFCPSTAKSQNFGYCAIS